MWIALTCLVLHAVPDAPRAEDTSSATPAAELPAVPAPTRAAAPLHAVPSTAEFAAALHDPAGLLAGIDGSAWTRVLRDERLWGPEGGPEGLREEIDAELAHWGELGLDAARNLLESSASLVLVGDVGGVRPVGPEFEELWAEVEEAGLATVLLVRPGADDAAFDAAWAEFVSVARGVDADAEPDHEEAGGGADDASDARDDQGDPPDQGARLPREPQDDPDAQGRADTGSTRELAGPASDAEDVAAAPPEAAGAFTLLGRPARAERTATGDALLSWGATDAARAALADAVGVLAAGRGKPPEWLREARGSAPEHVQFELVARVDAAVALAALDADEEEGQLLRAIGLDRVRWLYLGGRLGRGEVFDLVTAFQLPDATFLARLAESVRPVNAELFELVPEEAITATATGLDVPTLWKHVTAFLAEQYPDVAEELESGLAEVRDEIGIDPLEQLLFQTGGHSVEWILRAPGGPTSAIDPFAGMMREVTAVTLKDSEEFSDALGELLDAVGIGFAVSTHDHGDHEVHTFGLGEDEGLAWAFPDGAILFGSQEEAVHDALDRWDGRGAPGRTSLLDHPVLGPRIRSGAGGFYESVVDTGGVLQELLSLLDKLDELLDGELEIGFSLGSFELPRPGLVGEYFRGSLLSSLHVEPGRVVSRVAGR